MTLRLLVVSLACAAAAAGCGSPASPTPVVPRAAASPAPLPATPTPSPGSPAAPRSISVDAAAVVEVQYPGYSGWYYAPQVRVTETGGAGLVAILGVEVSIPGFGTWACSGGQDVAAGQTRELFPEIYGDYPVTFDKPGQRSSGDAAIAIRYGDQAGVTRVLTVTAPITPGELPKTYTGGTSNWRCGSVQAEQLP